MDAAVKLSESISVNKVNGAILTAPEPSEKETNPSKPLLEPFMSNSGASFTAVKLILMELEALKPVLSVVSIVNATVPFKLAKGR